MNEYIITFGLRSEESLEEMDKKTYHVLSSSELEDLRSSTARVTIFETGSIIFLSYSLALLVMGISTDSKYDILSLLFSGAFTVISLLSYKLYLQLKKKIEVFINEIKNRRIENE